ncbi:hypothetical protein R9C27_004435 [Escherichia coli]|nr:hypothetical protein [Escherichia coli]
MSKHYPGDDSRDQQMEAIAQQLPDDHRILDAAYYNVDQLKLLEDNKTGES